MKITISLMALLLSVASAGAQLVQDDSQRSNQESSEQNLQQQKKKYILNFGSGFTSSGAKIGWKLNVKINGHDSINIESADDSNGHSFSTSYRFYDQLLKQHKTDTFLDRCLFIAECDIRPYWQLGLVIRDRGTIIYKNENDQQFEYDINTRYLAKAGFGIQEEFASGWVFDVGLDWTKLLTKQSIKNIGNQVASSEIKQEILARDDGFGMNVTVGYQF